MILEGSEVNSLDTAWFRSFRPVIGSLLQAMVPEEEVHIRRLVEAAHTFSTDEAVQEHATRLWIGYQQSRLGQGKAHTPA